MKRFLPLLLLCIVIAAAFAIRAHDDRTAVVSEPSGSGQRAQNRSVSAMPPAEHQVAGIGAGSPAANGSARALPSGLAERTSWTNPFAESFWTSANWQFDADSMMALPVPNAGPQATCTAEFLREWRTFTASVQVETPANDESLTRTQLTLELEVVHVTSGDALRVSLQPGRVTAETRQANQIIPLRETSLTKDEPIGELRMSLTPNRLLVRCGKRLLLNVPRPSFLNEERCRFRISAPAGTTISRLRFDGE